MQKDWKQLDKLSKGDKVAIISPSAGLPGLFPWVQDLGLQRLREEFGLVPVEYPTTRKMGSSLTDRAKDITDAFSDPSIKAVFASIGGSDQIKLIKYLEPTIFSANPKPFFGYSDNTHLHMFLWNLGIPSFYGGSVMNQLAMNVSMFDSTVQSLNNALFKGGEHVFEASEQYNDIGKNWEDQASLNEPRTMEQSEGQVWDGEGVAKGRLWGGCVESLVALMASGSHLPSDKEVEGTVLILETAEDIPPHWVIEYILVGMGERGWLEKMQAVLVGRPKAWEFNQQNSADIKEKYRQTQRDTVLRTIRQYNASIPVIQNLDFGHTDPQVVLPLGGEVKIVCRERKIYLSYGT